jgi:deoxycytidine triphosphate deaminase
MVLSDVDIKRYIEVGKIKIAPDLPPEQFGSRSVDFRLGNEFNVFEYSRHHYIDLRDTSICAPAPALQHGLGAPTVYDRVALPSRLGSEVAK